MTRWIRNVGLTLGLLVGGFGFVRPAGAVIVERVVAVVGERPILLSELRLRARPYLYRIAAAAPTPAQQAAEESEMFKDLLNKMVDERLEEQAADKAHLSVTPDELDTALTNVAGAAKITVKDLLNEARRQGLTEQDYRDEIRRQILEGKLVQLRVRGRVRVTEQDARTAYTRWVRDLADQGGQIDLRIIALRLGAQITPEQEKAKEELAFQIVKEARAGADYCALVTKYSDDQKTKTTCGSNGPQPKSALIPELVQASATMKKGETSDPIPYRKEAILIVQMGDGDRVPTFDEVKEQMTERAYGDVMDRQRKQWLQELRRGIYVDVRL
jgi:peptidyl-prolyl cis-trans isomerase SurA